MVIKHKDTDTEEVVCPYCGQKQDERWEFYNENDDIKFCIGCCIHYDLKGNVIDDQD